MSEHFELDGQPVAFTPGQTVLQAAHAAGHYIPHLCWSPALAPHGSCRLCTVRIGGHLTAACTTPAAAGMVVENRSAELTERRRTLLQLLFVEGNHFCPACEKSGNCTLQATAYEMGMLTPHFDAFFPDRPVDASHPEMLIDFNRCILCELCVRASRELDGKDVFAVAGRGLQSHLVVNAASGRLADTAFSAADRAAQICPVGAILRKRVGFAQPIGQREYDRHRIGQLRTASDDTGTDWSEEGPT